MVATLTPYHNTSAYLLSLNDTASSEIYTFTLHDALPISIWAHGGDFPPKKSIGITSFANSERCILRKYGHRAVGKTVPHVPLRETSVVTHHGLLIRP